MSWGGVTVSGSASAWDFFEISESSAGGGDLQKFLRATQLSAADMLARETIQNSWDAARKLRAITRNEKIPFKMRFVFRELSGADKENFVNLLQLRKLHLQKLKAGDAAQVRDGALDQLDDDAPLRLLEISDFGAHGLYGHPNKLKKRSVLFNAVYYMGGSRKDQGMGGSYGVGKSAFIRGSHARTAFIHSTFRPYPGEANEDDPTTSRFLGFCWWTDYEVDGVDYDGRGRFIEILQQGETPRANPAKVPFQDAVADNLALRAGLPSRDPNITEELGTSLLLLDPSVGPADLLQAISRNWWPAIVENLIEVSVVDYDGQEHHPDPSSIEDLKPFVDCFHACLDGPSPGEGVPEILSTSWYAIDGNNSGTLAVKSFSDDTDDAEENGGKDEVFRQNGALIARTRGPRMVVDYLEWRKSSLPFKIRGVYVASEDLDELLRETEPALHDQWTETPQDDISDAATKAAKAVKSKIIKALQDYVRKIQPPAPKKKSQLDRYSQILARFINDRQNDKKQPRKKPSQSEPVEFHYSKKPQAAVTVGQNGAIRTEAEISLRVAEGAGRDTLKVRVSCAARILEDESPTAGTDLPVEIRPSEADSGFVPDGDSWTGTLSKSKKVKFIVESTPYEPGWSTYLSPEVTVLAEQAVDNG